MPIGCGGPARKRSQHLCDRSISPIANNDRPTRSTTSSQLARSGRRRSTRVRIASACLHTASASPWYESSRTETASQSRPIRGSVPELGHGEFQLGTSLIEPTCLGLVDRQPDLERRLDTALEVSNRQRTAPMARSIVRAASSNRPSARRMTAPVARASRLGRGHTSSAWRHNDSACPRSPSTIFKADNDARHSDVLWRSPLSIARACAFRR